MKTSPQLAIVLTLITTFFWGSNFQVTKFALASLPPWTASVERFFYAVNSCDRYLCNSLMALQGNQKFPAMSG